MRKTKIICTLGPASDTEEVLREMIKAGMNVARFNFSHGSHEEHQKKLDVIKKLRKEMDIPLATLLDTKGPEIRLGLIEGGKAVLEDGDTFVLTTEEIMGDKTRASISFKDLPKDVKEGDTILIDDGLIELRVEKVTATEITCTVMNGGKISDRKGVNVPNVDLSMEYLSEKDRSDIEFGIQAGFDFIAASFVRCAQDVLQIREILESNGCNTIKIIAKIENAQGVNNLDEILRVSDGIMIARGDMGVEIPLEDVPVIQKMIIQRVYNSGKYVITATQMLDSMMNHPRPTRAEATDVANAIYDGTSVIMLSGETAAGKYPVESVRTMAKIAEIIGEKADSEQYRQRSVSLFEETWKKEFMNVTPAFEVMKNNGLYQGTRWQYRWAAPQYIDKMIEWVGQDSLRSQLTYFFDHHLYNQGNEPDIHVPYLFNRLGAPEKTQQIVRSLMTEPMIHKYGGNSEFKTPYLGKAFKNAPEGYSPEMDEDDGTMSAWYVFGAMGFYPLLVGDEYYDLTSPLFDRVLLRLTNGNVLTIQTEGRKKKDAPIKSIHFNGKKIADYRISHNELIKGGELIYNYK